MKSLYEYLTEAINYRHCEFDINDLINLGIWKPQDAENIDLDKMHEALCKRFEREIPTRLPEGDVFIVDGFRVNIKLDKFPGWFDIFCNSNDKIKDLARPVYDIAVALTSGGIPAVIGTTKNAEKMLKEIW